MGKRRHGEGWTERRGDRWRARYWRDGKKVTIATCDTEDEADAVLLVYAEKLAKDAPVAGETLATWSRTWLDAREVDGHHRAVKKDRHAFKRVSGSEIAHLPLAAITPRDVRDWVADQVRSKAARQTIANALNLLRVCLEQACEKNRLQINPALGVKVPRLARTKDAWTWLRAAEIEALLAGTSEERDVFAVAIYTGMRAGELFGLEWRDVDVAHGQIAVRHSWKGKPTKTGHVRRVPLLAPAVEALERQRTRSGGRRHVFPARDGEPRTEDMCPRLGPGNAKLRAGQLPPPSSALERAGIKRHVRFHDLRHTCASALLQGFWAPRWVARSLRLEEVKEWLGHTSIATTQRYAHLCPEAVQGLVIRTPPQAPPNAPNKIVELASVRERKRLKSAEE